MRMVGRFDMMVSLISFRGTPPPSRLTQKASPPTSVPTADTGRSMGLSGTLFAGLFPSQETEIRKSSEHTESVTTLRETQDGGKSQALYPRTTRKNEEELRNSSVGFRSTTGHPPGLAKERFCKLLCFVHHDSGANGSYVIPTILGHRNPFHLRRNLQEMTPLDFPKSTGISFHFPDAFVSLPTLPRCLFV